MAVRLASLDQPEGGLGGGNQQKIGVAKWLASDVDVPIIDEPTVGVDVRTKEEVYGVIEEAKRAGTAVLVMAERRIVIETPNAGTYKELSEVILHAIV